MNDLKVIDRQKGEIKSTESIEFRQAKQEMNSVEIRGNTSETKHNQKRNLKVSSQQQSIDSTPSERAGEDKRKHKGTA